MALNPYEIMRNIPPEDAEKYFGANRSYEDAGGSIPGMSPEGNLWASIARMGEEQRAQEDAARAAQAKLTGQAPEQVVPSSGEDIIRGLMNRYEGMAKEGIQQRQSGINQLKEYAQQVGAMPRKADYTPFLSFVDSLGGGANLAKSYQRPETQEERMAKQFAMEQGIGKAQQGITEDQIKMMKERLDAELGLQKMDVLSQLGGGFKGLPKENQEMIVDLAKKNASKISIANQIDSVLNEMSQPGVSDEQKIASGRQLLKTLNSTEGADAIGAEEAKRLGSMLELFNVTGPGKFFSRDIQGFVEQARRTSKSVKGAVLQNNKIIQDLKKGGQPAFSGGVTVNQFQLAPWEK